jgi:hypothetical protein
MSHHALAAILAAGTALSACSTTGTHPFGHATPSGDHSEHVEHEEPERSSAHMWMTEIGDGWHLMAMGHVFPSLTIGAPSASDTPLRRTDLHLPHAGAMMNLEAPDSRLVVRFMPNFEGITLRDGETTFGAWGEGFIDSRHPHTLLHEAMLSFNWWDAPGGSLSLSAGRGFAPYGTDDPMYRPALKYPTNHHLSQILERWTANAVYVTDRGWGFEAGLFDGDEPEHWRDVGNIGNFGNSWSARLSRRFGEGKGPAATWEVSASYAHVRETHGGDHEHLTRLRHAAIRHAGEHSFGGLYVLVEAARSDPDQGAGYFSVLGEAQLAAGSHRPFYRVELATRPEYPREASEGDDFFRYDHGVGAEGASRWLIHTLGYGYVPENARLDARPFLEVHHHRVRHERGPERLEPSELLGARSLWSVALGVRVFVGGGPMRMGSYGVLDAMTREMRDAAHDEPHAPHQGQHP